MPCAEGLKRITSVTLPPDSARHYLLQRSHSQRCGLHIRSAVFFIVLATGGAIAQLTESHPVTTTQLAAWLLGGISSKRLAGLVREHGVANLPTMAELRQLQAVGADKSLMDQLASGKVQSAQIGPTIPDALLNAAIAAGHQRYHDAELGLRDALSTDDGNSALHFALAAMLRHQDKWEESLDEMAEATRLMPELPENHSAMAYTFYRTDDDQLAIAEARTALSIDPGNAEAYQYLGLGLYSAGKYAASAHAYQESLARDPSNADTLYDLGIALHGAGDLSAAMAAYQRAIRLQPAFWEAHANLALILHEEGNLEGAVEEYREAKQLAPTEASVRNNLGNTYCDQGNFDAAISELKDLYREHPEWGQGHACLASAYMAKKNYDEAVDELQIALRQNPNGSVEHRILGQALLLDDKPEEALHELRLAVALNPDSEEAHRLLGTVLFQQQQLLAAEKEFREALRLNPSADNHFALAACLMSLKLDEEALAELETASRLDPTQTLYRARREELLRVMKESGRIQ